MRVLGVNLMKTCMETHPRTVDDYANFSFRVENLVYSMSVLRV